MWGGGDGIGRTWRYSWTWIARILINLSMRAWDKDIDKDKDKDRSQNSFSTRGQSVSQSVSQSIESMSIVFTP